MLLFLGQKMTDCFFYYFGMEPQRMYNLRQKVIKEFESKKNGTFDLVHKQSTCSNDKCKMNAYIFTYPSTVAASGAGRMTEIHRKPTSLIEDLLPCPTLTDIADIIFLPLSLNGTFPLLTSTTVSRTTTTFNICDETCEFPCFPMVFSPATKEEIRHDMFYNFFKPYLESYNFCIQKEMTKMDTDFGCYSKYGCSALDIAFYHRKNFCKENQVVAGGVIMRGEPATETDMELSGGGIEFKTKLTGAAAQAQVEAESFLLASNISAVALSNYCSILSNVTTYIALVNINMIEATLFKMEFAFRRNVGSLTLTKTNPAPVKDVLSRLVHHLKT